jgi:hypothetical protein
MHKAVLTNQFSRERFKRIVDQAPPGYVAEVRAPKRTLSQNDKFWSMLTDISLSKPGGASYTPEEWKARIMHACGWECQFLPGILDGHPFPVGFRSSQMSKSQMSAMIDWMQAWGDEQGVKWTVEELTKEARVA